ncbi:MAG: type II secretion system protein [Gallionella sp.]|nr:type II secretion system protein [Gallionella sp.]
MRQKTRQRGFTLIEMVMVIVIMGVIGGIVAVFMKSPIDAYFDSARRAALTDVADTTVRRMARDVRKALPNSLRLPLSGSPSACIEFIPTKTGGRYRADVDASGNGDILDFVAPDASFDMLGANSALVDQAIALNDVVAVYNLGIPGADAYNLDNTSAVSSIAAGSLPNETKINIAPRQFPLASGSSRFHVIPSIEHVVSYVCSGVGTSAAGEGTGTLYRYTRVLASAYATPASCPVPPAATPVLAQNVSTCSFVYNGSDMQRNAILQVRVDLTQKNETVSLYHELHVDNAP